MTRKRNSIILMSIAVAAVLLCSACSAPQPELTIEAPNEDISQYLSSVFPTPVTESCTEAESAFISKLASLCSTETVGECSVLGSDAIQSVKAYWPELSGLEEQLTVKMQAYLNNCVENAKLSSEVYTEELEYRPDVLQAALDSALNEISESFSAEINETQADIYLSYDGNSWSMFQSSVFEKSFSDFSNVIAHPAEWFANLLEGAVSNLEYVRKVYSPLPSDASQNGFEPLDSCYGETSNTDEVLALLSSPKAAQLINGQPTAWTPELPLLPGTGVKYYLDDTILVLVWQEVNLNCVCTMGEVFVSDASQFRRKLTDDMYHSESLLSVQELAQETSAVLALSGDMSGRRNRDIGVFVYNGEIFRFHPETGDSCFITGTGDMLFSKRYSLSTPEEAQGIISDNNISYSLCFGPAVIENGENITPNSYPWGEIMGKYARNALGQLGPLHYLTFNGNYLTPGYSGYLTAEETAEIMLNHGCKSAYLLDGGFTACTVFNNQRINPVNGDTERPVSDIIYFASALPNT